MLVVKSTFKAELANGDLWALQTYVLELIILELHEPQTALTGVPLLCQQRVLAVLLALLADSLLLFDTIKDLLVLLELLLQALVVGWQL